MKTLFKILRYVVLTVLVLAVGGVVFFYAYYGITSSRNLGKAGPEAPTLKEQGVTYRDLNKNGRLDPYEDFRRPVAERVEDVLGQMTLEEKAGMLFITIIAMNDDGTLMERPSPSNPFSFMSPINSDLVLGRLMNHFNVTQVAEPNVMAAWHNRIQKLAERTRLGIPVTIASDPRHAFSNNPAASLFAGAFSQWPEPTGLGATRDTALVKAFAEIARQEYRAVGIRLALHPMADLATEPRWARINGTFGEDAALSAQMLRAYIRGFQGATLSAESVAPMTKHFSGGGPQEDGWDAHFPYGANQVYPGNNFDYHLIPFEQGAFPARTAQIMPYYSIPVGQTGEDVGFAFNKEIITDMLRGRYGFDGVVCSDWSLLTDKKMLVMTMIEATGWGVEDQTPEGRAKKALEAGIDQFGGEVEVGLIVNLVESGQVDESRIDVSVRRLLRDKFVLGLFDDPYVDAEAADGIVGRADFKEAGALAQRRSIVLLKNADGAPGKTLPLQGQPNLYVENMDPAVAAKYGTVVETPEAADVAILRLNTPFEPRPGGSLFESFFHQGDLDFKGEEKARILTILKTVPTIVDLYLERPAVVPEIAAESAGLLANFGASDEAVLDVIFGKFNPSGTLPFELPSSMEAVENQQEDVPYDSENPLFEFGFGLRYEGALLPVEEFQLTGDG